MSSPSAVTSGNARSVPAAIPGVDAIRALLLDDRDRHGVKLLMCVAWHNPDPAALSAVIQAGASVADQDRSGMTPLMYAAANNPNPAIVEALLRAGASADVQDKDGRTALIRAAESNRNPLVLSALLKAGADPGARDRRGRTAADAAKSNPNRAVLSWLTASRCVSKALPGAAKKTARAAAARPFSTNNEIVAGFDAEQTENIKIALEALDGHDGCIALHLAGYIDTYNATPFRRRVMRAIDAGYLRLIFDMAGVPYVSSAGVAAFVELFKALRPLNGGISMVGMTHNVREVFSLLGFAQFLGDHRDILEALEAITRQSTSAPLARAECPICGSRLAAAAPGRHRCVQCRTVLEVDAAGQVVVG